MTSVATVLGPIFVDDQGVNGEPIALLWPSLFTDHTMWQRQVSALRGAGWRTLAIDPPSHGQSPGPGRGFTMDECAQAAIEVLDALGVDDPVVVIGISWGGFVAPRIALLAPGRVRALVLFNTSAQQPMPSQRAKATLLTTLIQVRVLDGFVDSINLSTLLAKATRRARPEVGADIVRRYHQWDRRNFISAIRSVLLERESILDALPSVSVPTVVVAGSQDTILPPKLSVTLAAMLPNAQTIVVDGAAHLVPLDAPDRANAILLQFLQSLAVR